MQFQLKNKDLMKNINECHISKAQLNSQIEELTNKKQLLKSKCEQLLKIHIENENSNL